MTHQNPIVPTGPDDTQGHMAAEIVTETQEAAADSGESFVDILADCLDTRFEDVNDPELYAATRALLVAAYPTAF